MTAVWFKPFSAEADGYVRGEGVGMLVLKRLSEAEQAGDHIYGVIRGTAQNHGGRANSLTAPNPRAQADLLLAAYRKQVHLYFKEFPIENLHPWAKIGAITGRCVYHQSNDLFWNYHDWIFAHQAEVTRSEEHTLELQVTDTDSVIFCAWLSPPQEGTRPRCEFGQTEWLQ